MADAVLQGIGIGNAVDHSALTQVLMQQDQMRQRQNEREYERDRQKQANATANARYFENAMGDPSEAFTGSPVDPVNNQLRAQIMEKAYGMFKEGADYNTVQQMLAPDVNKFQKYINVAKTIDARNKAAISKVKEDKGFNAAALAEEANNQAYFVTDPETGKRTLKDISAIDPDADYVGLAIENAPERVTTSFGFDEYAKNVPKFERPTDISTYSKTGGLTRIKTNASGQRFLVQDVDQDGATEWVPKYETAIDMGEPIYHDFTDKNGKVVRAPVRALDKQEYENFINRNPGNKAYMRSLLKQHVGEYNRANGAKITLDSPQAELVARAIAYDELNSRKATSISSTEILNKPSAAEIKLNIGRSPSDLEAIRAYGDASRKQPGAGDDDVAKTISAPEVLAKVFTNDPDYSNGDIVEYDGKKQVDITRALPDLKYSNKAEDVYEKIYRDPQANTITFIKKNGDRQIVSEGRVFDFLNSNAGYNNNMNPAFIRKVLKEQGYANGKFGKVQPSQIASKLAEEEKQNAQKRTQVLQSFEDGGSISELSALKGQQVQGGTVEEVDERSMLNPKRYTSDKYYIKVKNAKGETSTINFSTKEKLAQYLKGKPAPAKPAAPSKSATKIDDLRSKYKY